MSTVSGAITNINKEMKTSKAGKPFSVFSVEVNGTWYEAGFKAPGNVGDFITFDSTLAYGKNKIVDGTLSKAGTGGAKPYAAAPTASVPKNSGGKTFPIAKDSPDRSIIRQNAVNRAVEVLTATGLLHGMVSDTPESKDVVAGHVIGLAQRFEAYYSGELDSVIETVREGETVV